MRLPRKKVDLLSIESVTLATYAVHSEQPHTDRLYPEAEHRFRTDFQRDRDRVLHSHAFRRLEYKTQVFLNGTGDHLRNRLTHTIEVAAISRTIANALGVNADLTEAVALAHDLGHTPFGHAGERTLSKLMADHGGFDHNLQALRIVDFLEIKYPEYNGINLTRATREALYKHRTPGESKLDGRILPNMPSLEAQIADLADDLTYYGHDVDDGINAGILTLEMLRNVPLWRIAEDNAKKHNYIPGDNRFIPFAVRCLIDMMVGDAIQTSAQTIHEANPTSPEDIMNHPSKLVCFSDEFQKLTDELKDFLYDELYFSKHLEGLNNLSNEKLSFLFEYLVKHPDEMGVSAQNRIERDGIYRAVADDIAGMTDNFAIDECIRLK